MEKQKNKISLVVALPRKRGEKLRQEFFVSEYSEWDEAREALRVFDKARYLKRMHNITQPLMIADTMVVLRSNSL